MPHPSAHYDYAHLEGLWIGAGGPPRLAPLMAAIAMAESGGNARAHNPSGATGLWQILGNPFPGNAYDPQVNARMAVAKWKSQGLGAWVTYTSGAYKRYFRKGVPPAGSVSASAGIPYRNPLRGVSGLTAERIDMGVDYAGRGPVYALGPGVITYAGTGDTGWGPPAGSAPGGFVKERLTAGPLRGRSVFVAEGITPQVRVGQRVTARTVIGRMSGGIETGFAAPGAGTGTLAAQLGEIPASGDPGAHPTAAGAAYSRVLAWTGAPAGVQSGQPVGAGSAPPWLTGILGGIDKFFGGTGAAGAGAAGGLSGIAGAISGIGNWLSGLSTAVDWLLSPSNWVRIVAGVGGGVLVLGGVVVLSHTGESLRGPLTSRPMALPVGILMVGGGGVLLFVAFHNLPGSPANVGELLGSLRDEAQAAAAGQQVAA